MTKRDVQKIGRTTIQISAIAIYAATAVYYVSMGIATIRMMRVK